MSVGPQTELQRTLRKALKDLQTRNPRYSIRAFAKKLGMQPSATNEILKGTRRVSPRLATRIVRKLDCDPTERSRVLRAFHSPSYLKQDEEPSSLLLKSDQFQTISDWVHFAILNLIETTDFNPKPSSIAKRLNVSILQVEQALHRLTRLGLIETSEKGQLRRTIQRLNTSDDIRDESIQMSHQRDLDLARDSLEKDSIELRDFTSLTFPADPVLLAQAKEITRKYQDELADLLESGNKTEVYRLCVALFPLTRRTSK